MKDKAFVKKVGQAIARQRKLAGLTQAVVASELDIETITVSRIETGAISSTLERLEQFSKLFGCPVEAFFREDGDDAEALGQTMADLIRPLRKADKRLLVGFVAEAVKLFRSRRS